jgi:hypothetical protein
MSSATSIDRTGSGVPDSDARPRDAFKPWHLFVLLSLLAATAAVVMARQSRPEHLVLISLTIGAAGFAAATLYRTLAPLVSEHAATSFEPLSESMRAVLEREKLLALRAIKELEFDRSMGKVSPRDFDEMAGRLRARAMALMKQLDAEGGYRELIEQELSARLRKPAAPLASRSSGRAAIGAPRAGATCACGTENDADAVFCKRCGSRVAGRTAS